ncbi:hypothetical protein GC163_08725 [bacterium]|nr:hypothetical protein [bacterium]
MDSYHFLIGVATFLSVTSLVLLGGRFVLRRDYRVDDRLGELQSRKSPGDGLKRSPTGFWKQRIRRQSSSLLSTMRTSTDQAEEHGKLQSRLLHAGIYSPWALSKLLVIKTILMIAPPVIGSIADSLDGASDHRGLYLGIAGGAIGMLLPGLWLDRLKHRRHVIFARSLPDFLDMLVTCLEAGMSIEAALQRVSDELQFVHPILGGEMKAVQTQIDLGATPDAALRSLADRTDYDSLRSLSTVVQQARRFGTGVAEALRQHANALRIQREQVAEEKAQKASVQILMPTMLLIFPAIFVVLAGPAAIKLSESFAPNGKGNSQQVAQSSGGSYR